MLNNLLYCELPCLGASVCILSAYVRIFSIYIWGFWLILVSLFLQNALFKRDDAELNPYYWNITGIYRGKLFPIIITRLKRLLAASDFSSICLSILLFSDSGTWRFMGPTNSSKFVDSSGFQGVSVLELLSKPSKLQGVHYVTVQLIFRILEI